MGFKEARYMIIMIAVVMFVCNVFAVEEPSLASLKADNLNGSINNIYDINTGRLTGAGNNLNSWTNNLNQTIDSSGTFDFVFKSWSWIKSGIAVLFGFIYSPYELVRTFVLIDNLEFLWWLPPLVGLIWTIGLVITFFMILWKE